MKAALVFAVLVSLGAPAFAEDAVTRGTSIAQAAEQKSKGFKSFRSAAKMVLRDKSGATNMRDFTAVSVEVDGGSRTLLSFQSPGDIRGVALLTHANNARENDQWLYLPANGRVRRIAGASRQGNFAGSEFSYEDMLGVDPKENRYELLREEACPGAPSKVCYVNQSTPLMQDSGYSRVVGWLDKQDYRAYKAEYYDRGGALIKTLAASDFRLYDGRFWRPMRLEMTNVLTGKSTSLDWSEYLFGVEVNQDELQPFALGR